MVLAGWFAAQISAWAAGGKEITFKATAASIPIHNLLPKDGFWTASAKTNSTCTPVSTNTGKQKINIWLKRSRLIRFKLVLSKSKLG